MKLDTSYSGTSPRLWGDSLRPQEFQRIVRYIPTSVGRFLLFLRVIGCPAVHPHVCGEIVSSPVARHNKEGTSPRLWGDCLRADPKWFGQRYIPTSVGRLPTGRATPYVNAVHPHVCGEILDLIHGDDVVGGTSPRLWGDWRMPERLGHHRRYIPTSVGRFARL